MKADQLDCSTVRSAYAAVADLYIELFGSVEQVHADDLDFLRRHLGRRDGCILDAGCGPGHLTAFLADLGRDVTGIDVVPEFLDHARASHPSCTFREASFARLDAAPGSISGILAWGSLIHLPAEDVDRVLAEFGRVVEAEGVLVLALFAGDDLQCFDHKVTPAYFWSPAGARRRLAAAGFDVIDVLERSAESTRRAQLTVAARRTRPLTADTAES